MKHTKQHTGRQVWDCYELEQIIPPPPRLPRELAPVPPPSALAQILFGFVVGALVLAVLAVVTP